MDKDMIYIKLKNLNKKLNEGGYYDCKTYSEDKNKNLVIEIDLPFISPFDSNMPFQLYVGYDLDKNEYYLSDRARLYDYKLHPEKYLKKRNIFILLNSIYMKNDEIRIDFDYDNLDTLEIAVTDLIFFIGYVIIEDFN